MSELKSRLVPGNEDLTVYFCDDRTEAEELRRNGVESTLLLISGFDWNRDLSPWPAARVFKKGEDFAGEADRMIPEILTLIRSTECTGRRFCTGYSLAGLFVLYLCTKTDLFDGCVSASGSLWYPDFIPYLEKNKIQCTNVYLSLGDAEKNTRNPVMARVLECTEAALHIAEKYTAAYFELNPGNHFNDPEGRTSKGIRYLENYGK